MEKIKITINKAAENGYRVEVKATADLRVIHAIELLKKAADELGSRAATILLRKGISGGKFSELPTEEEINELLLKDLAQ